MIQGGFCDSAEFDTVTLKSRRSSVKCAKSLNEDVNGWKDTESICLRGFGRIKCVMAQNKAQVMLARAVISSHERCP